MFEILTESSLWITFGNTAVVVIGVLLLVLGFLSGFLIGKFREADRWVRAARALRQGGQAHDQSVESGGTEFVVLSQRTYQSLILDRVRHLSVK
jgi:UPF0716 family protein affecting phage T7 exclusion